MVSLRYTLLACIVAISATCAPAMERSRKERRHKKKTSTYLRQTEPDALCSKPRQALMAVVPQEAGTHSARHLNVRYREGIDVSHYQGEIDWQAVVKNTPISYAYLKATEGATLVDDTYQRNLREARQAGLMVGSYHFYRPNTNWREQLKNLTENVNPKEQDLVPIIDIEHKGNVSDKKFIEDLRAFLEEVRKYYGAKPLLYTFQNFYNKHLAGAFPDHHWMIAKYKTDMPQLTDNQRYIIWQYTAKGRITGIKGNVDRSRLMDGFQLSQIAM